MRTIGSCCCAKALKKNTSETPKFVMSGSHEGKAGFIGMFSKWFHLFRTSLTGLSGSKYSCSIHSTAPVSYTPFSLGRPTSGFEKAVLLLVRTVYLTPPHSHRNQRAHGKIRICFMFSHAIFRKRHAICDVIDGTEAELVRIAIWLVNVGQRYPIWEALGSAPVYPSS